MSRELSRHTLRVAQAVRSGNVHAIVEVVPAYASLMIFYDPTRKAYANLLREVRSLVERTATDNDVWTPPGPRKVSIPVSYDGEDLQEVAERTGHTRQEVIALHAGRDYHVYMIGFVPGFAYLGELDPSLVLPRRAGPRKRVPPGAVAIAEGQTGVYPFATPGGWHLIGTTATRMFDASAADPALLRVGDVVHFDIASK